MFSREELLGGLPARRASTVLFAIESRTARLVAQARQAGAWHLSATMADAPERAFLQALGEGRDQVPVTIQDLEHYAPNWAPLVPEGDASLRAAIAKLMADKYRFTYLSVPGLRRALSLDDDAVQLAFQRHYSQPITTIYAPADTWRSRLRWGWTRLAQRLENLPPFWLAFFLTLPVGSGILALPIALARVGPLPGIGLLLVFGLINALTVAALAETVARSAITRFGLGYLGQLVADYLGRPGSLFLTAVSFMDIGLVLVIFYLGIAGTLAGATGVPAWAWVGVVFVIGLYFVSRRSLSTTVASSLVVGFVILALVIVLPVLALPHFNPANLAYVNLPLLNGQPFDPDVLRLVFGIMLSNYFSHMLVANYGRVVLQREPTGRAWIRGSVAAIGAATLLSCLWILLINGAIAPEVLAAQAGTVLEPLSALAGPVARWLGAVLVVLGLGIASIHLSLGSYFLTQERLPPRLSQRARTLAAAVPLCLVFGVAEWLAISGLGSFAGLLGFSGVISLSLMGGIFPVLLLAAARRKGDFVPEAAPRLLGSPMVLVALYLVFVSAIFAHGLFIWQTPLERGLTLAIAVLVVAATVVILRRGALERRAVIEVRHDQRPAGRSFVAVTVGGQPGPAQVQLGTARSQGDSGPAPAEVSAFAALRSVMVQLPPTGAAELKVWVHALTPEGNSQGLPAGARLRAGAEPEPGRAVPLADGAGLARFDGQAAEVLIDLPDNRAAR